MTNEFRDVTAVIRAQLDQHLTEIEKQLDSDVLAFVGPILFGVDVWMRRAVESLADKRKTRLALVLDTEGGVVEIVERMVDTVRHHYAEVGFYVPDRAMSAGTVFALSGDSIAMDYFSLLGPIDPQVEKGETLVPALAYLIQYERLIARAQAGELTTAELVLLQKLDLGELQQFEEARELSISLLKKWLVSYKFKDWRQTETRGLPVTREMKEARAEAIAKALSDPLRWHSHGRGISMNVLRGEEIKLRIDDFGSDATLSKLLREYLLLLREFMHKNGLRNFCHTRSFF